jgi:hypothetical protein
MPIKITMLLLLFYFSSPAQQLSKATRQEIYQTVLSNFYRQYEVAVRPTSLVMSPRLVNREITRTDFRAIAENLSDQCQIIGDMHLDISWLTILQTADKRKNNLRQGSLNFIPSLKKIGLITNDSVHRIQSSDNIELSDIILLNDKAIVEVSRVSNYDQGEGCGEIFFLERIKGIWTVVSQMNSWMS